ncbi:hypothetical protein PMIN01_02854 [Paraphaeosphaeria minitans]|uniref:Uncharacterized protein n=1 Tax=Paraphaeosphaeria minitans TaxID=565426 RepID=A0A9P6GRH8_9PLEO|nr:hypothetical protein PMIN01_02854 [Paraphaeosphaeria minitans]
MTAASPLHRFFVPHASCYLRPLLSLVSPHHASWPPNESFIASLIGFLGQTSLHVPTDIHSRCTSLSATRQEQRVRGIALAPGVPQRQHGPIGAGLAIVLPPRCSRTRYRQALPYLPSIRALVAQNGLWLAVDVQPSEHLL